MFGDRVSGSSLKSYFGHTTGACGALEAWMSLQMMRGGLVCPYAQPALPDLQAVRRADYIMGESRRTGLRISSRVITASADHVHGYSALALICTRDLFRKNLDVKHPPRRISSRLQAPQGSRRASWLAGRVPAVGAGGSVAAWRLFTLNTVKPGSSGEISGLCLTSATAAMISPPLFSDEGVRSAAISKVILPLARTGAGWLTPFSVLGSMRK